MLFLNRRVTIMIKSKMRKALLLQQPMIGRIVVNKQQRRRTVHSWSFNLRRRKHEKKLQAKNRLQYALAPREFGISPLFDSLFRSKCSLLHQQQYLLSLFSRFHSHLISISFHSLIMVFSLLLLFLNASNYQLCDAQHVYNLIGSCVRDTHLMENNMSFE